MFNGFVIGFGRILSNPEEDNMLYDAISIVLTDVLTNDSGVTLPMTISPTKDGEAVTDSFIIPLFVRLTDANNSIYEFFPSYAIEDSYFEIYDSEGADYHVVQAQGSAGQASIFFVMFHPDSSVIMLSANFYTLYSIFPETTITVEVGTILPSGMLVYSNSIPLDLYD